jgi:hypothetical protein
MGSRRSNLLDKTGFSADAGTISLCTREVRRSEEHVGGSCECMLVDNMLAYVRARKLDGSNGKVGQTS